MECWFTAQMAKKTLQVLSPNAQHLCCDIHMRENVKRKIVELGISGHTASEIMFDIFGKEINDEVEGGLIHCSSTEEFDSALQSTTSKWKTCHTNGH